MRVLPSLLFASGALAAAVARHENPESPEYDCFLAHANEMAADAACGDASLLASCFSKLHTSDPEALGACYKEAGCTPDEFEPKVLNAQERCAEVVPDVELRRRRGVLEEAVAPLTAFAAAPTNHLLGRNMVFPRDATSGDACMTTTTKSTKVCDTKTEDGKQVTGDCSSTGVAQSSCLPGKTCSMDKQGENICMDLKNSLDVAGIIIAIVFGVAIIAGIVTLTWLCVRDKKEQKRLAAKAEATALARAATKKKKAAEAKDQRTPLMREQRRDPSAGATDPFHDQNMS